MTGCGKDENYLARVSIPTFQNLLRDVKCGALVNVLVVAVLLAGLNTHLVLHSIKSRPSAWHVAVQLGVPPIDSQH